MMDSTIRENKPILDSLDIKPNVSMTYEIEMPAKAIKTELIDEEYSRPLISEEVNDSNSMCDFEFIPIKEEIDMPELIIKEEPADTYRPENTCEIIPNRKIQHKKLNRLKPKDKDKKIKINTCYICLYRSKDRSNFRKHMLVHMDASEVRMFKCEACNFQTRYKQSLTTHQLTHTAADKITIIHASHSAVPLANKT